MTITVLLMSGTVHRPIRNEEAARGDDEIAVDGDMDHLDGR